MIELCGFLPKPWHYHSVLHIRPRVPLCQPSLQIHVSATPILSSLFTSDKDDSVPKHGSTQSRDRQQVPSTLKKMYTASLTPIYAVWNPTAPASVGWSGKPDFLFPLGTPHQTWTTLLLALWNSTVNESYPQEPNECYIALFPPITMQNCRQRIIWVQLLELAFTKKGQDATEHKAK